MGIVYFAYPKSFFMAVKKDKRVDAYIAKAQPFAQPILKHIRKLIHEVVPDVEETIKWGMPSFDYKGPIFGLASFKAHCSFYFWKAALMKDAELFEKNRAEGMGNFGRITAISDLPKDKLMKQYLLEAKRLNEENVKLPKKSRAVVEETEVHPDFEKALKKNKAAREFFQTSSPSCRKEYNNWINEAKRDETRNKRIEQAVEWLSEGKQKNWKYMK